MSNSGGKEKCIVIQGRAANDPNASSQCSQSWGDVNIHFKLRILYDLLLVTCIAFDFL